MSINSLKNAPSIESQPKMRVLVAGHFYPPIGGIAVYYQTLIHSSLDQKVTLFTVETSSQTRQLSDSGSATLANGISALHDCWRFTQAVLKRRPQVAHIATAFGLSFVKHSLCVLIARLLGCRVLLHPHCGFAAIYSNQSDLWKRYFRQVIRLTDGVIGLSAEWQQLETVLPGCRVYPLFNAVNLELYQGIAAQRFAYPRREPRLRILYLGYLSQAKGSFDLLDAVKKVSVNCPSIHFDLVGDEAEPGQREQLARKIREDGLERQVTLSPPVFEEKKLAYFRKADIFIHPSHHEGMPIAILEAMACGLPIIATRVGGIPDLVADGINGLLVAPGSPDQLAEAICSFAEDPQRLQAMGCESYRIAVEHYGIEQHVETLTAIYRSVLFQA